MFASGAGLAAAGRATPDTEPPAGEELPASTPEPAPATRARLMVYTARLELLVASVEEARERFIDDIESRGGYLQKREGDSVTCRVPSREFDAVLEGVRKLGKVLDESLRALDVTKEYRDLEIQLDNAKKSRERLLALLEKATEVEDLLKIETELRRLTGEIERLQGQLKYLADQIALSTIEVVFRSNAPPVDPSRRDYSSFWWINQLGVDSVLDHF